MFKGILKYAAVFTACCMMIVFFMGQKGLAAMKTEVISSTKTLPGDGEFNVIAEPFDWGKDVTRIMLKPGGTVAASDVIASDFTVNATHYSEQAYTNDFQGERKVLNAYPVDSEGVRTDNGEYIIIELEYGSNVAGAHTGSYNYANYYTPLTLIYDVSWSRSDTKYTQHEVVNLVCDEFVLDRYTDSSISDEQYNFVDYAMYSPQKDGQKHPLIIFFHGMGEGGAGSLNNHGVQMYAYPECNFADTEIQNIMGGKAYVLLPQSPETWPTNGFTSESGYLEVVNSLIDNVIDNNPEIDTNRIYVGGLSMGGYMASRVILDRPDKYAAAFLCSQAYAITEEDAAKLVDLPIWISCSEADYTCRMDPYTYASYEKLVAAGGKDVKCAVMESNASDPTSRFRFYSSDSDDYVLYYAEQENENTITGDFVWDNVSYSGHNGGWVPVFANGEYYLDDNGEKITIMEWVAAQSLVSGITLDTSGAKTEYNTGDTFSSDGIVVNVTYRDGSKGTVTDYSVTAPDMSTEGVKEVQVTYSGITAVYSIKVSKPATAVTTPVTNTAVNPAPVVIQTATKSKSKVFKVAKKKLTVKKGKKVKIKVKVSKGTTVKFKSSKPKIAKVSKKGVVRGIKKGKAKITITAYGKKKTVTIKVK